MVDALDAARPPCPTYGLLPCVAGQINRDVLNRPDLGRRQVLLGERLAPYNRTVCLIAGLTALGDRKWDEAAGLFGRYVELGGSVSDVAPACVAAGRASIPFAMVRHDRRGLLNLAGLMPPNDPHWAGWRDRCRSDAAKQLAIDAAQPNAPAVTLAELAGSEMAAAEASKKSPEKAIPLFCYAVCLEYSTCDWRLALAKCLMAAG